MRLFDTLMRETRELQPADGKTFGFYCCGPTVYGPAHIGNFRTFVLNDVLRRVLEVSGMRTRHVRNITDVDDKILARAKELGEPIDVLTARTVRQFHQDIGQLGALEPDFEPRATQHARCHKEFALQEGNRLYESFFVNFCPSDLPRA